MRYGPYHMDDIHGVSDIDGNRLTDEYVPLSRNIFFAKDVAPRWTSRTMELNRV